jgi:hypothetical protein
MTITKSAALLGLLLAAGAVQAQKVPDNGAGAAPAPEAAPAPDAAPAAEVAPAAEAAPAPAAGGMLSAADPASLVAALQGLGQTASLGTDEVGDPMISAERTGRSTRSTSTAAKQPPTASTCCSARATTCRAARRLT